MRFYKCIILSLYLFISTLVYSKPVNYGMEYGTHIMTNQNNTVVKILDLPQKEYFTFDEKRQGELQDKLEDLIEDVPDDERADVAMIAIGTPDIVDLDKQKSLPVLVGSIQSRLRNWQVYFKTNLHVFIKNHSTGRLWTFEPLVNMRRGKQHLRSSAGTPPNEIESQTISSGVQAIDLLEHSEGRITPGLISVTAIADDLISNTTSILLKSSGKKPETNQTVLVPRYLQAKSYNKPSLENQVSIPSTASNSGAIPIKVAIQVKNDNDIIVGNKNETYLSAHIILIKLDERPVIIPATVPVKKVATPEGSSIYNAVFQLDLKTASQNTLIGKYRIYIDSGKDILGPYSIEVTK